MSVAIEVLVGVFGLALVLALLLATAQIAGRRVHAQPNLASPHGPPVLNVVPATPQPVVSRAVGGASAVLTVTGPDLPPPAPPRSGLSIAQVGQAAVTGQHQAVVDITGSTLPQIEAAVMANGHEVDPRPDHPGEFVARHPIYLTGEPSELDAPTIRKLLAGRYSYVSPDPPEAA